jgi:hypothetical protein
VAFFAGHEHGDAAAPRTGFGVPPFAFGEQGLEVILSAAFLRSHGGYGGGFAHEDDAPLPAPTFELEHAFQALPTVPGFFPVALAQAGLDKASDVEGVLEFE